MISSIPVHGANLHCLVDGFVCLGDHFLYFNDFFRLGIGFLPKLFKGSENLLHPGAHLGLAGMVADAVSVILTLPLLHRVWLSSSLGRLGGAHHLEPPPPQPSRRRRGSKPTEGGGCPGRGGEGGGCPGRGGEGGGCPGRGGEGGREGREGEERGGGGGHGWRPGWEESELQPRPVSVPMMLSYPGK
uniref:Uncharacterized protein n=1 Tax=Triticum urartu TaxID=4572 RepID=A0A8R7PUX7_TRIUA